MACPFTTQASFQHRLATSRRPGHETLSGEGGVMCAASPARTTGRAEALAGPRVEAIHRHGARSPPPALHQGGSSRGDGLVLLHLLARLARLQHELPAMRPPGATMCGVGRLDRR